VMVRLMGGLGNQLFQYAAGRRLSIWHGAEMKLDISSFQSDPNRSYSLGCFRINAEIATPKEISRFTRSPGNRMLRVACRAFEKCRPYYRRHVMIEPGVGYDANIFRTRRDVYLAGYWQSEKYFKGIEELIRNECALTQSLSDDTRHTLDRIASVPSVSVHIRRGDYVTVQTTNRFHGCLEKAFYTACMDRMRRIVSEAHFFIFSDDSPWAVKHFGDDPDVTVVTHNTTSDRCHEDLFLMAHCEHSIISNSTFSWWGAWLNRNPSKIIMAPEQWCLDPRGQNEDLIPETWERVSA
jgi:hypothetical protein